MSYIGNIFILNKTRKSKGDLITRLIFIDSIKLLIVCLRRIGLSWIKEATQGVIHEIQYVYDNTAIDIDESLSCKSITSHGPSDPFCPKIYLDDIMK